MATKIQLRRDLAASWTSTNPILGQGEPGLETDTNQIKYGNGHSAWQDLPYSKAVGAGANLDITRTRAGQITVLGEFPNSNGSFWFDSIVADDAGNSYGIGGNDDSQVPTVVKMNAAGVVQWQTRLNGVSGVDLASGSAVAGHLDPTNGELVVVSTDWSNTTTAVISRINPSTGAYVADSAIKLDDISDLYAYDIALTSTGDPVVVGGSYGEFETYALTPLSASNGSGRIQIALSDIAAAGTNYPTTYSNWHITGTDVPGEQVLVSVNTWYDVTGTATTGTGAVFDVTIDIATGAYYLDVTDGGVDYEVGSVVTILGTDLGGTIPANDVTVTVTNVNAGLNNSIGTTNHTGLGSTTNIILNINAIVDFADTTPGRAWSLKRYLDQEAFVWTPNWKVSLGTDSYDVFQAVGIDSQGNIYAGGHTGKTDKSMVVKFNSDGDILWTKSFDPVDNSYWVEGIAVDSEDNVVITLGGKLLVTKINGDGTIIWQFRYGNNSNIDVWSVSVDIDMRDNSIIVAGEMESSVSNNSDFMVLKFSTTGVVLWQRSLGTASYENTWWNDGHQVVSISGDYYYIAGSTEGYGGNANAVAFRLPLDGSGVGENIGGVWNYYDEGPNEWSFENLSTQSANIIGITSRSELLTESYPTLTSSTDTYDNIVVPVYSGPGGSIEKVKSIIFEDDSELTTGNPLHLITQPRGPQDNATLWLNLTDIGTQIYFNDRFGGNNCSIYVPPSYSVNFPIGSEITLVVGYNQGSRIYVNTQNNGNVRILAEGFLASYNNHSYWSIAGDGNAGVYKLLKVDTDVWVLSGPTITDEW